MSSQSAKTITNLNFLKNADAFDWLIENGLTVRRSLIQVNYQKKAEDRFLLASFICAFMLL